MKLIIDIPDEYYKFFQDLQYYSSGRRNGKTIERSVINAIKNGIPFEPDYVGAERVKARQRGYEQGYHKGMKIGKTLNPKIKQGEWETEETATSYYTLTTYKCPFCGRSSEEKSRFCPDCGAELYQEESDGE